MPLTPTGEVLARVDQAGAAAGAFNVIQLEHAEAIVAGAEAARSPVILQVSENAVRFHGALEPIGSAMLAVARAAAVPVAVHLDHATRPELVYAAVGLGFGSVMFDAADRPYEDNVAATAELARWVHERGAFVEGELGEVGGKDGVHAPGAATDPDEAAAYVAATGVDALAVAVGTSHAMHTRDAAVDFGRIAQLRGAVPVPLVLHGSSGVADAALTRAVGDGMRKINIATHLNRAFTEAVRRHLASDPRVVDTRKYLGAGRDAVRDEVARLLGVLGSAGTAVVA